MKMEELVEFLIIEKYCNKEFEAIKILESVSDVFYNYLVEAYVSAIASTDKSRKEMDSELKKASSPDFNPKKVIHLRKKIKGLKGPLATELAQKSGSKSQQSTPRGKDGSRIQQRKDVVSSAGSISNISPSLSSRRAERAANRLIGAPEPSVSVTRQSPEPSEVVRGRYKDKAVLGGRGTRLGNWTASDRTGVAKNR